MRKFLFIVVAVLVLCSTAYAQVPREIHFQGFLTDAGSNPLTGNYSIVFRIYDSGTGGSLLWEETHATVDVTNGYYDVTLGTITALNLAFDAQYYLAIEVELDGEMTPRFAMAAAPYALRAAVADDAEALNGEAGSYYSDYNNLTNKPASLPPDAHTHVGADITSQVGDADTVDGQHAAEFAASSHAHAGSEISSAVANATNADLLDNEDGSYYLDWTNVTNKPANYAPTAHTHVGTDVTSQVGDADTVDGQHASAFAAAGHGHADATGAAAGFMSAADWTKLNGIETGAAADMTANEILAALLGVDGSGSQLDADRLDGQDSTFYRAWANLTGVPADIADGDDVGVTDHGALTGLGDDDHTQYLLANGTRALTGNLGCRALLPTANGTYDLGAAGNYFNGLYFDDSLYHILNENQLFIYTGNSVYLHLDDNDNSTSYFRIYNGINSNVFQIDELGNVLCGNVRSRLVYNDSGENWLTLQGNGDIFVELDEDNDTANYFRIRNGANTIVFQVDESGNVTSTGTIPSDWSVISNIPADIADGDDVGLTSEADTLQSVCNRNPAVSRDQGNNGAIQATNTNITGWGVYGEASATGAVTNYGVYGEAAGDLGRGVYGGATATGAVTNNGVQGVAAGNQGRGVFGEATATGAVSNRGLYGTAAGDSGLGVLGVATATGAVQNTGVYGRADGDTGRGVRGTASATGNVTNFGIYGDAAGNSGCGVYGRATATGAVTNYGVQGSAAGDTGRGVYGYCGSGYGIHGSTTTGYAGYFSGNTHVAGTLSKTAGSFLIDHPADPKNKVLRHSFVESPEMTNIYKGRAKLENGKAIIELPDYFDALNHPDGREVTLTCVNGWSPIYLEGEIKDNKFVVKTTKEGNADQEFSWVIYAVRNDAYAQKNPIIVEEEKGVNNDFTKGEYLNPEAFGEKKKTNEVAQNEETEEQDRQLKGLENE